MAELALGTVRALLDLIRKEAQLLAGVRGDVQFIRDEMESINGLLRHLEGTKERASDHQVRAWMKQVMELAYDSSSCVQRYAQNGRARDKGLLGRLRWVFRLPRTFWIRRRVAIRIRKLKVRAREIGERQQRYGVAVPAKKEEVNVQANKNLAGRGGPEWRAHADRGDASRRAILAGPDILTESTEELIRWLKEEPGEKKKEEPGEEKEEEPREEGAPQCPRVIAIVSPDGADGATLAKQVYEQSSNAKLFELTARVTIQRPPHPVEVLMNMLRQFLPEDTVQRIGKHTDASGVPSVSPPPSVKGKKLLVVLSSLEYTDEWTQIKRILDWFECSAGSAVVFSTKNRTVADGCSPSKTKIYSLVDFHLKKAVSLVFDTYSACTDAPRRRSNIRKILERCNPDVYCMNMFLHSLYINPNRAGQELSRLCKVLHRLQGSKLEAKNQMITFCYDGLPEPYKNCLLYSAAFARGSYQVRRTSLVRRWVAEGLIAKVGQLGALDEAERCFDALLNQKLLLPSGVRAAGKVKSCAVDASVTAMIKDTTDEDFLDTNQLPPDFALHLSIRNGIHLHRSKSTMEFLKSLPTSSRLRLLRVLDLEGCEGLNMRHLKNICKIPQLKYLSLRNTGVAQLPKQIDNLKSLETLDIRQTRVQVLDAVLPMLKHLLAGCTDCPGEDTVKSKESFSTVRLPRGVACMEKLEILSRVKVFDCAKELINIGDKLEQLRKLGVVLCGKKASPKDLFIQIDKFHRCLRSLSIRMEPPANLDTTDDAILVTPPRDLESLNICGIRGGLPPWIKELHRLAKITLRDTSLKEDALTILGVLGGLRCLRLRYRSFAEGALTFGNGQFSNLMDLVIEDDILSSITFASGTAPKLDKMVWSFTRMESLSGVQNLPSLRHLELDRGRSNVPNGLEELQRDIKAHRNRVVFKLNPQEDGQGSGDAGAAS